MGAVRFQEEQHPESDEADDLVEPQYFLHPFSFEMWHHEYEKNKTDPGPALIDQGEIRTVEFKMVHEIEGIISVPPHPNGPIVQEFGGQKNRGRGFTEKAPEGIP